MLSAYSNQCDILVMVLTCKKFSVMGHTIRNGLWTWKVITTLSIFVTLHPNVYLSHYNLQQIPSSIRKPVSIELLTGTHC